MEIVNKTKILHCAAESGTLAFDWPGVSGVNAVRAALRKERDDCKDQDEKNIGHIEKAL